MSTPKLSRSRRTTFLSFQPPAVGEDEIEAVAETIRSGWLTTGPRTAELEERFAAYTGAKHAIALSSGTESSSAVSSPRFRYASSTRSLRSGGP